MKIRYKNTSVKVSEDYIKPDTCCVCGQKPKPRGLQHHHYIYAYSTEQVRDNPELALENTIPVCTSCHIVANAVRVIMENPEKAKKVFEIVKEELKKKKIETQDEYGFLVSCAGCGGLIYYDSAVWVSNKPYCSPCAKKKL